MRLALNYPRTPGFERVPCRAPAFGLRQLAGALLAARSNPRRLGLRSWKKAATSRRSPNAVAPAKPPAAPRVRYAPNADHSGGYGRVPFNVHGFDRDFVFSLIGRWMLGVGCSMFKLHPRP